MTGRPLRYGVVGHGWRADFHLRLARQLPDRFECAGVVTRTTKVGERLEREWGVPTFRCPADLVAATAPEVVVTSVPREANPDVIRELVDLGVAVLSETPPAEDTEGLRRLWADVGGSDLVQVAEQHPHLPAVAALRALVETGVLGQVTSASVSWTHDYHAMALLRFVLGVGFEPARVSGVHTVGPVMEGPDRGGWPTAPQVQDTRYTLGIVEVAGRTAVYDFTDGQWFNPLRRRQVVLRGSLGEVVGRDVTWCGEPGTTVSAPIVRRQSGVDGDLEGTDLETLSWAGRVLYRNPYRGARLSDEEIAIATSLEMTGAWRRGRGRAPYPLAEACQDHLLSLAVHESAERGAPVSTGLEPWGAAAEAAAEPVHENVSCWVGVVVSVSSDVADVLIVGGGMSAGVAARHLAEAGFRVVVLEQGEWVDPGRLPGNKPEYEVLGAGNWHPDPNVRHRPEDYPIDVSESDLPLFMYNGVGGSSVLYGGVWARALPSDFRVRTLDGVADDWPISYAELEPYYRAVEAELGVAGLDGNPAYPAGFAVPLDAAPIHRTGRRMAEGMNGLGWHWWPGTNAIPTRKHGGQGQCVRYGICRMGCPEGAKGSTDVTHFPFAVDKGATVVTRARVSEITVDGQGRATGAVYLRDGREHFQPASVVLLAANAIGTSRLLLMSTSKRFPNGLANSSGLVGKRLMLHPYASSVGLYDHDELEDWLGPAGEHIGSMQFYETDASRGFVRGAKWSLIPIGGPLEAVDKYTGQGSEAGAGQEFWGPRAAETMRASIGRMLQWHIVPEDLPEEENQVSLSTDLTDSDGLPAATIRYRVSENTRRLVDFHLARTLEAHQAAGAVRSWTAGRNHTSGHNTGTARMGEDPATSVVDRYGRAHDVPNLYVIDGSVFPTSTGVNVGATISALAKRTAVHLVEQARHQAVGA